MITRIAFTLIISLSINGCKSTYSEIGSDLSSSAKAKNLVRGYDLSGFKTMDAAPNDMICTAVLRPEEEACRKAHGKTIWAAECKVLCSDPIASTGKVAGYNFNSFVITDALPDDVVCAAVLSAEQEACFERGGKPKVAAKCRYLCSVPIAQSGKVSGFNFDGPQLGVAALSDGQACTQILRPEEDACRKAGGKVSMTNRCSALCSVMISR